MVSHNPERKHSTTDAERLERRRASRKKWKDANPEKVREMQRVWRANNRETFNAKAREYRRKLSAKARQQNRAYNRDYYHSRCARDPHYRLLRVIRARIGDVIAKVNYNNSHTVEHYLGYSPRLLKEWAARNGYKPPETHIDHIVPLAWWLRRHPDDFVRAMRGAWNLANLRVIPAAENQRKNAKREFLV